MKGTLIVPSGNTGTGVSPGSGFVVLCADESCTRGRQSDMVGASSCEPRASSGPPRRQRRSALAQPDRHSHAHARARVLLDAHNCYPEADRWADRIDRALATGIRRGDRAGSRLVRGSGHGQARSIVSHGEPFTGREPSLESHFFERIRPLVEKALRRAAAARPGRSSCSTSISKTNEPEHHRGAVGDARQVRIVADDAPSGAPTPRGRCR